jgi:hypothetical protein
MGREPCIKQLLKQTLVRYIIGVKEMACGIACGKCVKSLELVSKLWEGGLSYCVSNGERAFEL